MTCFRQHSYLPPSRATNVDEWTQLQPWFSVPEGNGSVPSVKGIITTTGHFQGTVTRDGEQYVIEKSSSYFQEPTEFHSVIYRTSDIDLDIHSALCGADIHRENLLKIQKTAKKDKTVERPKSEDLPEVLEDLNTDEDVFSQDTDSDWSDDKYVRYSSRRTKRTVSTKNTCELYIQADHRFYQQMGSDKEAVIEALAQAVQTLNSIYPGIGEFINTAIDLHMEHLISYIRGQRMRRFSK